MVTNAFIGRAEQPGDAELAAELGPAKAVWDNLLAALGGEYGLAEEWHSYSRKAGWALRLKKKDRNIVYLSPGRRCFMVSFALGDKAIQAARASKLPKPVIEVIDTAKRYAEGTAVRLDVTGAKDIPVIRKLVAIKLEN